MPEPGPALSIPPAVGRALRVVALLAFAVVALRCAWMSDDAFITLRHLEHLCEGHGLRYNVAERVQAFTHPLWALLLLPGHALTRDPYYPPLVLSLVVGTAAVALAAWRTAPSALAGAAGLVLWTGSKAFVDFTTSGLENPLTHLLAAGFAVELLGRRRPAVLAGLTGLMMTNRLDTVLLVGPALAWAAWTSRTWRPLLWALPPLVAWHGFSLVYYGFALPNTAYAKLSHGIGRVELLTAGGYWLSWATRIDPTTVLLCVAGLAASLRERSLAALAAGPALYIAYVVWVGGDFMGDRFLSAPVLLLVIPLLRLPRFALGGITLVGLFASLASPWSPWWSGPDYRKAPASDGIVDERGFYWKGAGWLSSTPGGRPAHRFAKTGERVGARGDDHLLKAVAGFVGYYAGPDTHVVDPLGLTDPLLARLPAEFDPDWRTGHFRRHVPRGYVQAAGTDDVQLPTADAQALNDALGVVTRGPLFTVERWRAILALHTGGYPVDPEPWRYPSLRRPREIPSRVTTSGAAFLVEPGASIVDLELDAPRKATEGAPWTVRADDGVDPLRTWALDAGTHRLELPHGTRRLLLFARSAARVQACSACRPKERE